jgi:hypothetical protein
MKLKDKISWLMGRVQGSLFSHISNCMNTALTEQEQRLATILEFVQVERYIPQKTATQWFCGRILERESLVRMFVAKAVYRFPTSRDLIHALRATKNFRWCRYHH